MAAPREVKVTTLEGGDLTVKVLPTNTIEELKAMLLEKKHCEDPIERQILKVKVLADRLLVDDDQTVESAGLLHAESEVTVIYSRNEVEAAAREAIHAEGLLQVNIPSSLTVIPVGAFENQNQVVKVTIPESVTIIQEDAFAGCGSLQRITIPESVTTIGDNAFANCESLLESITIPDSVTDIGGFAFAGCKSLASITIPESVTAIRYSAFANCESLASIMIPELVTDIGGSAFAGCKSLTSITLPESVTAIRVFAFADCESLASITIPESVTDIGDHAFANCESLASITIPESVTDIGGFAFAGCKSLASITIPESVTTIGDNAFANCESLASIMIPELVTDIGGGAFAGCKSLTSITLPESVTAIRYSAFADCESLASITIPESVTDIGDHAFANCESLASITIPESVTDIGDNAFAGCKSLASITIPKSTWIGYAAFDGAWQAKRRRIWVGLFVVTIGTCFLNFFKFESSCMRQCSQSDQFLSSRTREATKRAMKPPPSEMLKGGLGLGKIRPPKSHSYFSFFGPARRSWFWGRTWGKYPAPWCPHTSQEISGRKGWRSSCFGLFFLGPVFFCVLKKSGDGGWNKNQHKVKVKRWKVTGEIHIPHISIHIPPLLNFKSELRPTLVLKNARMASWGFNPRLSIPTLKTRGKMPEKKNNKPPPKVNIKNPLKPLVGGNNHLTHGSHRRSSFFPRTLWRYSRRWVPYAFRSRNGRRGLLLFCGEEA